MSQRVAFRARARNYLTVVSP